MELAADCYELTKSLPREETFGLVAQIRRAAASVPANIAEGYGRESSGSYVQFLKHSQGSLKELETHVLLGEKVGLLDNSAVTPLLSRADAVGRMLRGLIKSLQRPGASR